MPDSSPSVLIIRLDAIGDALALTPLIAALRERGIPVDAVLTAANAEAFARQTLRNAFIAPFGLRDGTRDNRAAIRRFAESLPRDYTDVLVATEDMSGYRLGACVPARRRAGFHNGLGKAVKTLMVRPLLTDALYRTAGLDPRAPHECDVLFALGRPLLGAASPSRDPNVLGPLVVDAVDTQSRVLLQVTDKFDRLGMTFEGVSALVDALAEQTPVRLVAASRESAYAAQFAKRHEIELFEDMRDWKAAVAGARAVVAPDSGAIHVAGMTGVPTVAIFPPQRHLDRQVARWHPWAAPYRIVVARDDWPRAAAGALRELTR